ncbi:MAG TPA: anthranilate synthase component I family protein [Spirochaetota bacterium]|nr:anthranilate synthase component I family protein [Spirochaetota bacterium]HOM38214.1 anthranilate synthase component I family protein [Spirochaetota bacterium]HPQ48568.1 anthranilate synthase component I family protein [Spirochaetota bacterium]
MIPEIDLLKKNFERYESFLFQQEIAGDIVNPIILLKRISSRKYSFLLESAKTDDKILARYSFLGYNPSEIITYENNTLIIEKDKVQEKYITENPFSLLKRKLNKKVFSNNIGDFIGGYIGIISYESVNYMDNLREKIKENTFPIFILLKIDKFFVYDNYTGKLYASFYIEKKNTPEETYKVAEEQIKFMREEIFKIEETKESSGKIIDIKDDLKRDEYIKVVENIKKEIENGEAIQVVISKKYDIYFDKINPVSFYRSLRNLNPSPYMFYLKLDKYTVLGSSPETHLKVKNRIAYIKPIAGTYPIKRETLENDKKKLLTDPKEVSEHLMLLDLARNDLYTCCDHSSVVVEKSFIAEEYSHVLHIVSSVKGKIKDDYHPLDLFEKTFPAGTVSGAPKVRAIELINQYENSVRGFYAGCVGYFSYNSDIDTCITIRSALIKDNVVTLRAGAGIVYDSIPEKEADEVENKLKALFKALERINELEDNYVFTR